MEHREKTEWHGEYLGVSWEIQRYPAFGLSFENRKWNWTFYLNLVLERIPDEYSPDSFWLRPRKDDKGRVHYDYYKHGVLSSIDWHGGITWYSNESGHDGAKRSIKAGCDYQHARDYEYGEYALDNVKLDVMAAIRSFRDMVPTYRYWCRWDGRLHAPEEIEVFTNGAYDCECSEKNKEAAR